MCEKKLVKFIKKSVGVILATSFIIGSSFSGTAVKTVSAAKKPQIEYYAVNDKMYNSDKDHYFTKIPKDGVITIKKGDSINYRSTRETDRTIGDGCIAYIDFKMKKDNKVIKRIPKGCFKAVKVGKQKITLSFKWLNGKMMGKTLYRDYIVKVVPRINVNRADVPKEMKEAAKNTVKGSKVKVVFTDDFGKDKFDIVERVVYLTSECQNDLKRFGVSKEEASIDARIKHALFDYYAKDESNLLIEDFYDVVYLPLVSKVKGMKIGDKTSTIKYKSDDNLEEFDKVAKDLWQDFDFLK